VNPMPRPVRGDRSQGTFLRLADVRSQSANISMAGSRSILSRRVVSPRKPPDHHPAGPTRTSATISTPSAPAPRLAAQHHALYQAGRRLDNPFHIRVQKLGRVR
jgi:hypothetical protein